VSEPIGASQKNSCASTQTSFRDLQSKNILIPATTSSKYTMKILLVN